MNPDPAEKSSLTPDYFDDVYRRRDDPWDFQTSPYEAAKYAATLAALPTGVRFNSALEIGCSIGVFTAQLADRCERLLALDVSEAALAQARVRCAALPQVTLERRALPAEFPAGRFDLIVLSEVGYYFSLPDLRRVRDSMVQALPPGGYALLVHWTPLVPDYPITGDAVHDAFLELADERKSPAPLRHEFGAREEKYRLDLFKRQPTPRG